MTPVQKEMSDYILEKLCACARLIEVQTLERIATALLKKEIEELKKQLREK